MDLLLSCPWAPVPHPPTQLSPQLIPFYSYTAPGLTVHTAQNRDQHSSTFPFVPLCWAFPAEAVGFYWGVISWIEITFQSIQQGAIEAHGVLWGHSGAGFTLLLSNTWGKTDAWKCMEGTIWWSRKKGIESESVEMESCNNPAYSELQSRWNIWIIVCSTSFCVSDLVSIILR